MKTNAGALMKDGFVFSFVPASAFEPAFGSTGPAE
jgi:hypothetical protein